MADDPKTGTPGSERLRPGYLDHPRLRHDYLEIVPAEDFVRRDAVRDQPPSGGSGRGAWIAARGTRVSLVASRFFRNRRDRAGGPGVGAGQWLR